MPLRVLAVGDIHLGRRPARLPASLAGETRELNPAGAWARVVDSAIQAPVHYVLLAGDVVEREDDFYEAYRELNAGVGRLAKAGIGVLGVAGNHDVQVLPRLADQLDAFQLLGRGGTWESRELGAEGETLTLHGWSFPHSQVNHSPLEGVRFQRGRGPNLGLFHCDRDQRHSPYAPVTSRELDNAALDGWLLGHIHAPDALCVERPSGYLGSLCGMDPGEAGDHGPWLLGIEGGRIASLQQWVLAPLRWEGLSLDLGGISAAEQARDRLLERLREVDARLAGVTMPPRLVGLRLRLSGRCNAGREVEKIFREEQGDIIFEASSGARYFIEHCASLVQPEIPLRQLAERSDPPGLLARRLLLLEQPEQEEAVHLIAQARKRLRRQSADPRWQQLQRNDPGDTELIDWLRRAGTRLLEDMLEQQPETRP